MAGYDGDHGEDYDTDEVSLTPTVKSTLAVSYPVDEILSEGWTKEEDGSEKIEYLVRWEGTWEPTEHLAGTDSISLWEQKKREMGDSEAERHMNKNEKEYYKAKDRADAAKARREAKRDKKKRHIENLNKQGKPLAVVNDAGTTEDVSPRLREWVREQQSASPRTALATREAVDNSQLNSLFVDSLNLHSAGATPPPGQPEGNLPVRQPPGGRKAPLEQSESSSSEEKIYEDGEISDDSLMRELRRKKAKEEKRKTTGGALRRSERRTPQNIARSPKSPVQTTTSAPSSKITTRQIALKVKRNDEQRRSSQGSTLSANRDQGGSSTVQKGTDLGQKDLRQSPLATRASSSTTQAIAKRTVSGSKPSGGIRIVNEPKTHQRAPWQNGKNLYNKIKFRGIAERRARTEGTPDPGALDIVNPPIGFVNPKPQPLNDSPYSRRETGTRRIQDDESDDTVRRGSLDAIRPLESWEAEKVPLVCPHWRLSNNCLHGPRKCHFLHRNQDALGRDYPVGDVSGVIPPKHRKPPLTCIFWLRNKVGCKKQDWECIFAHKNTGWIQGRDEPLQIDPNEIHEKEKDARRPFESETVTNDKRRKKPSELTCYFWAKGQCRNSSDECAYQHCHTGVLSVAPGSGPRRLWANGDNCPSTADESAFNHHYPGINSDQLDNEPKSATSPPHSRFSNPQLGTKPRLEPVLVADAEMEDVGQPNVEHNEICQSPQTLNEQSPPPLVEQPPARMICLQMKEKIEQACKLDFADMFASNDGDGVLVDRRAFLVYHPKEHSEELDLITRWLLMHHVEVGNAWYDGSWDNFKQQILEGGSGVIIAHPDFEYFTELPEFGQVLRKQVRLWSIGLQEGIEYDAALSDLPPAIRYDCIEIFPLGGFIYITDDVFEKKPQVALKIVKSFFAKIDKLRQVAGPVSPWHELDDVGLLWRLCVRPELMEYLLQYCEDHVKELEEGDACMQSRAELYKILSETNYIEQDDPSAPLSLIPDGYPILSERRVIAEEQPVDYFNTLARSQEDANLHMIRYYAGLQVDMRRDYRHFFVVHTEPAARCAQQWKQEIQTVAEVITPEMCVEVLDKEDGAGLVDFYEKYMAEYQVKDWKALEVAAVEGVQNIAG
ncbi:uncharacterized protein K460DRAFT_365587 [Cucurbitaria berberidis CBS 394.84]|uniref:C3H1-type domain-containing protein n=1 Tax=Cucurbitaria berberidis CBS 394.84 TaxID=1168544 RepID=A0A9P4GFR6_9PLEO|nr:uncharacterized protein K460DRAFT_365587 [Cucurbitaria berberidis CBS 394.84]KAF1844651.1 hypothetical protein K460DRAFT_365587 [Cucurbitaria berberidis CBS 394.84]